MSFDEDGAFCKGHLLGQVDHDDLNGTASQHPAFFRIEV